MPLLSFSKRSYPTLLPFQLGHFCVMVFLYASASEEPSTFNVMVMLRSVLPMFSGMKTYAFVSRMPVPVTVAVPLAVWLVSFLLIISPSSFLLISTYLSIQNPCLATLSAPSSGLSTVPIRQCRCISLRLFLR